MFVQNLVKVLYLVRNAFMINCFKFSFEHQLLLHQNLYEY